MSIASRSPDTIHSGPSWSPDGEKIAFEVKADDSDHYDIYVMNAGDGSEMQRLTSDASNDTNPAWSPDGEKIAFISYRDGDNEIYVMNSDGSGVTRLTTYTDVYVYSVAWGTNTSPLSGD